MMQLLKTVKKSEYKKYLKKIFKYLIFLACLLSLFLYGKFSGLIEGYNLATDLWTESRMKFTGEKPIYDIISEAHFSIFAALFCILVIRLISEQITSRLVNLLLLLFVFYEWFYLFRLKQNLFAFENFESSYFDIVRETIFFDFIGTGLILITSIYHIISVVLFISERRNAV